MIPCLSCGAECLNGLALCDLCRRAAATYLDTIAIRFRNLARWRPGRAGSRDVPGSREPRPFTRDSSAGDRVGRALDETGAEFAGWAKQLHDDRGVPLPIRDAEAAQVVAVCHLLAEHLTSISTLDWCGDLVRGLRQIEHRLALLTERVVPGWYAGQCGQPTGFDEDGAVVRCATNVYVMPGVTWTTCPGCGTTMAARDRLDIVLREAADWMAPSKQMAAALVALLDSETSVPKLHDRIRKWESLGWITGERRLDSEGDPIGPKRYRLEDVVELALGRAAAPTRPKRMTAV